jgi:hypothetical protein
MTAPEAERIPDTGPRWDPPIDEVAVTTVFSFLQKV